MKISKKGGGNRIQGNVGILIHPTSTPFIHEFDQPEANTGLFSPGGFFGCS